MENKGGDLMMGIRMINIKLGRFRSEREIMQGKLKGDGVGER